LPLCDALLVGDEERRAPVDDTEGSGSADPDNLSGQPEPADAESGDRHPQGDDDGWLAP